LFTLWDCCLSIVSAQVVKLFVRVRHRTSVPLAVIFAALRFSQWHLGIPLLWWSPFSSIQKEFFLFWDCHCNRDHLLCNFWRFVVQIIFNIKC